MPAAQLMQTELPAPGAYEPGTLLWHVDCPAYRLNVPAGQGVHASDSAGAYVPAWHWTMMPPGHAEPAGHGYSNHPSQ